MIQLETLAEQDSWAVQQLGLVARFFYVVRNPREAVMEVTTHSNDVLHQYFGEPVGTFRTIEADLIDLQFDTTEKVAIIAQQFRPAARKIVELSGCEGPVYEYIDLTDQCIAQGARPELQTASKILPNDEVLFDMFATLAAPRQRQSKKLQNWLHDTLIDSLIEG